MMHDSGGWHWGFGVGHWSLSTLIWVLTVLAVVALVKYMSGGKKP